MKKQLLLFILPVMLFTVTLQAQKVWDLGNDGGGFWPVNAGVPSGGDPVLIDNIAIYPHTSSTNNMGVIEASNASFSDGFTAVNRFKTNGGGAPTDNMPTVRYLTFAVTGNCDVKVWCRSGGSSARSLFVTDGTNVLGQLDVAEGDSSYFILTASYTGGVGNIYIYGSNNFSLYKIEASANVGTTTLGLKDKVSPVSTNLQAVGNRVYVSNVKSSSEITIYSITGALVKSFKTNSDTNFAFKSGLYIATIKTLDGQKSVKLLLN